MFKEWYAVFIPIFLHKSASGLTKQEANVGGTVKLPCPSNDEGHRFQYWQLVNDEIIGPWNNWKGHKFKYEVTTGELTIQEVTSKEAGFYKCISRDLAGPNLHTETVQLVVNRDWEEEFEEDTMVNTYRALIAFFCLLIVILFGILAYIIGRRKRSRGNLEDNDSPDELLQSSRRTYKPTTISSSWDRKKRKPSNEALIGDTVDTDMKTAFPIPDFH
ncbi:UNVERIFIED_CONTAM: hypothetical protein PYX00_005776 [Menopon gallinae]|uniref:Ig-like domain-containing protein n=1 Tax=Menopon gallinae TaxID=328185 RepID=A0AAW2HST9_9NEOP